MKVEWYVRYAGRDQQDCLAPVIPVNYGIRIFDCTGKIVAWTHEWPDVIDRFGSVYNLVMLSVGAGRREMLIEYERLKGLVEDTES